MNATKRKFVNVTPLSNVAKHRFITIMNSFHACVVQEEKDDMMYLISLNKQYNFWVEKSGSEHWKVEK